MLCEVMGRSLISPMVFNCSAPDTGNIEILLDHGTDEQKARWLEPLLEGDDPLLLLDDRARDCRLRPDRAARAAPSSIDGEWVINAHKWFTSAARSAPTWRSRWSSPTPTPRRTSARR